MVDAIYILVYTIIKVEEPKRDEDKNNMEWLRRLY